MHLNAIYDALDLDNPSEALNLCLKQLKKFPNDLLLQSLRAVSMVRKGQFHEAQSLVLKIASMKPTDSVVLQTLASAFRELGHDAAVIPLFENAVTQLQNEQNMTFLFMEYARNRCFKQMQSLSMKLFKQFPSPRYYFWSVTALISQSVSDVEDKSSLQLRLAERMMSKAVEDGRVTKLEELDLYLTILLKMENYVRAIEVLSLQEMKKLFVLENDHEDYYSDVFRLSGSWHLLFQQSIKRLSSTLSWQSLDQWSLYDDLILSAKHIDAEHVKGQVLSVIQSQQEKVAKKLTRAPWLAEISARIILDLTPESAIDLLICYVKEFASRPVCYSDLMPLLKYLTPSNIQLFITKLKELPSNEYDVSDFLLSLGQLSVSDVDDLVLRGNLTPAFMLLVAAGDFPKALSIVQNVIESNAANFEAKLLLIRLYHRFGAFAAALDVYNSLEVKNVQCDSLSYLILDQFDCAGFSKESDTILHDCLAFYSQNLYETPKIFISAYDSGSYCKAVEIDEFWQKISYSRNRVIVDVEHMRVTMVSKCKTMSDYVNYFHDVIHDLPDFEARLKQILVSSRDISAFPTLELNGRTCDQWTNVSNGPSDAWIKLHLQIPVLFDCLHHATFADLTELKEIETKSPLELSLKNLLIVIIEVYCPLSADLLGKSSDISLHRLEPVESLLGSLHKSMESSDYTFNTALESLRNDNFILFASVLVCVAYGMAQLHDSEHVPVLSRTALSRHTDSIKNTLSAIANLWSHRADLLNASDSVTSSWSSCLRGLSSTLKEKQSLL